MRTITQVFIALSIFACFAAATPACTLLNNEKELCQAASSFCTWTDDPASDTCYDACPHYIQDASECTATNGCAFTPSTCTFSTKCSYIAQADCINANNCIYIPATCQINPNVSLLCNDGGSCVNPLPAYCTKTTAASCVVDTTPAGTCVQSVVTSANCTAPCSVATAVNTCISICTGLFQEACGQGAAANICTWANNTCTQNVNLVDCSTVVDTCGANPQCAARTVYNCSTTSDSLNTFCAPATAGTACTTAQSVWCSNINTDICTANSNYCVLGQTGKGCDVDDINCSLTQASCLTRNSTACTWSADSTDCNQEFCTGSFASCKTAAKGGCKVNGAGCSPNNDSCQFKAGGTCAVKLSETN